MKTYFTNLARAENLLSKRGVVVSFCFDDHVSMDGGSVTKSEYCVKDAMDVLVHFLERSRFDVVEIHKTKNTYKFCLLNTSIDEAASYFNEIKERYIGVRRLISRERYFEGSASSFDSDFLLSFSKTGREVKAAVKKAREFKL